MNCLSDVMFESALQQAQRLDRFMEDNQGKTFGPLHGLPVSLKDAFRVQGVDTSLGFVGGLLGEGRSGDGEEILKDGKQEEAEVVEIIRRAGGVVFVKTNVPTSLMVSLFLFLASCPFFFMNIWTGSASQAMQWSRGTRV